MRDGESFITYYPGPTSRVTGAQPACLHWPLFWASARGLQPALLGPMCAVGVDCSAEAPVIGCQWFTWSPEGSEHFRWALAPARTFFASAEVRSSERRVFLRVRLLGLAHAPGHACNSMLTRGPVSSICFRLCRR